MKRFHVSALSGGLLLAMLMGSAASADIVGLVPGSYRYNEDDAGSAPVVGADFIQLTTGRDERRSIFFYEPQPITQFTASFTYRSDAVQASGNRQGLTFVVQNNPAGSAAIGSSLGNLFGPYGLGYEGLTKSAAVTMELDTGPGQSYSGYFSNGLVGNGSTNSTAPVNAFSTHEIAVTLTYSGDTLSVTMRDVLTGATAMPKSYLVGSFASLLGADSAYIGFTASTGGGFNNGGANQYLSGFTYSVPEPTPLVGIAVAVLALRRRA